jgi:hypothetical protein
MQQDTTAPLALLEISQNFKTGVMGAHPPNKSPSSIGDKCFKLLDLRAAIKSGRISDPSSIREAAYDMDGELEAWRTGLDPSWRYAMVDARNGPAGTTFNGKIHIYNSLETVQGWNNWRTLRILVSQIILQNENRSGSPDKACGRAALSVIRQMSTEVCISTPLYIGSPRKYINAIKHLY